MKDFQGVEIVPGSMLAKGGKGNSAAEYGMIAYRVLSVDDGKIQTVRMVVTYPKRAPPPDVSLRKTTITNPNAVVVIKPTAEVSRLFAAAAAGTLSEADRFLIGTWVHGPEHERPWGGA